MGDPKTLADKPVADRRGDDALDRHVPHVLDHPEADIVDPSDDPDVPAAEHPDNAIEG